MCRRKPCVANLCPSSASDPRPAPPPHPPARARSASAGSARRVVAPRRRRARSTPAEHGSALPCVIGQGRPLRRRPRSRRSRPWDARVCRAPSRACSAVPARGAAGRGHSRGAGGRTSAFLMTSRPCSRYQRNARMTLSKCSRSARRVSSLIPPTSDPAAAMRSSEESNQAARAQATRAARPAALPPTCRRRQCAGWRCVCVCRSSLPRARRPSAPAPAALRLQADEAP